MSKSGLNRANLVRLAFTATIGAAFLAVSVPANAQEEDDGYDIQVIRRVLSAVGLRDDKPPIDYRERSPLVVPPSTSLPPPMSGNVTAANWPVDPEIQEARMRKNTASKAPGATGDPVVDDGKPLLPSELAKGRAKRGVAAGPITEFPNVSQKELGTPNVFSFFSKAFSGASEKAESKTFTQEPPRTNLLEPPPGYQTPASTYAYGVGKKDERPTAKNYSLTHGEFER